ncbi:DUF6417 family protein [Streptomyces sp. NPDC055134]
MSRSRSGCGAGVAGCSRPTSPPRSPAPHCLHPRPPPAPAADGGRRGELAEDIGSRPARVAANSSARANRVRRSVTRCCAASSKPPTSAQQIFACVEASGITGRFTCHGQTPVRRRTLAGRPLRTPTTKVRGTPAFPGAKTVDEQVTRAGTVHPDRHTSREPPCRRPAAVVEADMNNDVTSLIPAQDATARRLAILTLEEAHDLLRLLRLIADEGVDELSQEAEWFAREIAARVPSEN